jgi:16S rRNA (cytosine967-C5)-methyltransferase
MPVSARQACLNALLEWEKGRSFSDEILHRTTETHRFSSQDRGFLMESFFGILRNLSALDYLADSLRQGSLDKSTRAVIRLGLYQIFHLNVPPHAAVNETVSLGGKARGLVNAVLRRALREKNQLAHALLQQPLAIRFSHPEFLIERWHRQFGETKTLELLQWNNRPAEVYVRANALRITPAELTAKLPASALPTPVHPAALKVQQLPLDWVSDGLCYVQDPSTLFACDLLDPQPGDSVLDACAAPGGKTTYLAEKMQNQGTLVACDLYESRLDRLKANLQRMGVQIATVLQTDSMQAEGPLSNQRFDRILVDAPCSNTGVLRRRVDVRWRLTDEDFLRMPAQQLALLRRTASLLKPGGTLVYSTCSLEKEENEDVVSAALQSVPELQLVKTRRILPFVEGVDGAFAAQFVRT